MNYVKGFRFYPTDEEAIELLFDKRVLGRDSIVQVGDSVVRVITQLKDICEFEPWELPERSELESGDNVWYFFCSPRYKYRKGVKKNRLTKNGYWNETGKSHHLVTKYDGIKITGTRKTLVFYRGRVGNNKKENKTGWVIHEFELTLNLPNIKSIILCKLKLKKVSGKVDVSRGEEGQSSRSSPSNVENHNTNNAVPEDQLNSYNEPLIESEAFNENSGIQTQFTTNEQDDNDDDDKFVGSFLINDDEMIHTEQRSNQPYFSVENEEGSKLLSNFQKFGDDDHHIPEKPEYFGEQINQNPKAANDTVSVCAGTLDQAYITSEHDNSTILTANNQTYSKDGSNQHKFFAGKEGSTYTLSFEFPVERREWDELLLQNGIFMDELLFLSVPEAAEIPVGVEHDKFSTKSNEQDDEFWSSISFTDDEVEAYPGVGVLRSKEHNLDDEFWSSISFTNDEVEAYPGVGVLRSKEHNLASKAESFNFSSTTTSIIESPDDLCSMKSPRKRPRIEAEKKPVIKEPP